MPYGGTAAPETVYPTSALKRAPKAKRVKKPKAPCKYGPRTASGRCPKKPKNLAAALKRDREGGADAFTRGSASGTLVGSALEKAAGKATDRIAGQLGRKVNRAAGAYAAARTAGKAGTAVGAASAGQLAAVALAGIASYYITSKVLQYFRQKKLDRAAAAAAAADAYRLARLDAVRQQRGRPLTAAQHAQLAAAFKSELRKLGLDTSNLKGL